MAQRMVDVSGLTLSTESFGDPTDPTCLLVMGYGTRSSAWADGFIGRLVDGRLHVIRYDNRDTGESSFLDFAVRPYTLADMAQDGMVVLDAYGVARAHVVGLSMGGFIAQVMAIEYADRIQTLTILSSSPASTRFSMATIGTPDGVALPPPDPRTQEAFARMREQPPTTLEEYVEERVMLLHALAGEGTVTPEDEATRREAAKLEYADSKNIRSVDNHGLAIDSSPPDRRAALRSVRLPTLVVHGTADPIFPHPHGVAIADSIPGARLLSIEDMGHGMGEQHWPMVASAILEHTAGVAAAAS